MKAESLLRPCVATVPNRLKHISLGQTCSILGTQGLRIQKPSIPRSAAGLVCCQAGTSNSLDYKSAGVDIDAGNELVRRIKKMNPSIGGFSGYVPFGKRVEYLN